MKDEECLKFLLSLSLFDCSDEKRYFKTLYSISNNSEKYYKVYKIKKDVVGIVLFMNLINY